MTEWDDWIGRTQTERDWLSPALLARFHATFDSDDQDDAAPQGIHWCLCTPDAPTARLDGDGHPMRGGFLPPIPLPRRMWASSKVSFHMPILSGAEIEQRSTIAGITEKSGGSGTLIFVDIDQETYANGAMAVTERQTLVYRDALRPSAGSVVPEPAATPPAKPLADWSRSIVPDPPLLFRYSALTFNTHRIHYDLPYATSIEGYPGLVVHGPLSATLLLDLAGRNLGGNRLATFAFRGQSPAFADRALHLAGRMTGDAVALEAVDSAGTTLVAAMATLARG